MSRWSESQAGGHTLLQGPGENTRSYHCFISPALFPLFTLCLHPSLPSSHYSYLARTKKADVARVEKRTFICTERKEDAVTQPKEGVKSKLGHWMAPAEMNADLNAKYTGCMKGMSRSHKCVCQLALRVYYIRIPNLSKNVPNLNFIITHLVLQSHVYSLAFPTAIVYSN